MKEEQHPLDRQAEGEHDQALGHVVMTPLNAGGAEPAFVAGGGR